MGLDETLPGNLTHVINERYYGLKVVDTATVHEIFPYASCDHYPFFAEIVTVWKDERGGGMEGRADKDERVVCTITVS